MKSSWSILIKNLLLAPIIAMTTDRPENIIVYDKGYRFDRDGWIYIHIEGEPYERGIQYGYLAALELQEIMKNIRYLTYWDTGKDWQFFVDASEKLFIPNINQEYLQEIKGIAKGANAYGININWQDILTWNCYSELTDYWWPNEDADGEIAFKGRCSAFIATGKATSDGKIVIAHNTWGDFATGQFYNMILDIKPSNGHRILMQSVPGHLDSFKTSL